jgi:hypothetical protein
MVPGGTPPDTWVTTQLAPGGDATSLVAVSIVLAVALTVKQPQADVNCEGL